MLLFEPVSNKVYMGKNRHARQRDTALPIPRIFDTLSLIERRRFSQNQVYPSTRDFLEKE